MSQDHSLTGEMVLRKAWSEQDGGLRTSLNGQFAVDISHNDGDSVHAISKQIVVSSGIHDCSEVKSIAVYTRSGNSKVSVSPLASGDVWVPVATDTAEADMKVSSVIEIRAVRIKVESENDATVYVVMNG